METIYKVIEDCEVKKVGERQYEFTASTSTQDRDGEVIDAAGWDLKNFKKNPVIMYAHDYRSLPIGKASRVWLHNGTLKNTVEFPPEGTYEFADIVERLVDTGYLKTESVGFIPKKWEDGDGEKAPRRTYTKQELLEISIVPIPSNPDALRNAVEEGVITTKQFEAITKPEGTEDYIRIPVSEGHEDHKIRTIDISKDEGIKALYCVDCKENITYLFDKEKWTMAKAKKWVKEHEKKIAHEVSQSEIIDEIDYLKSLIEKEGLSEDGKESFEDLMRVSGYDNPVEIKEIVVNDTTTVVDNTTIQTITYQEIKEAIKRIANTKMEE
uniref:Putative prohead protease n=1 Tax=viral metagenome TaxID=1070528 RepID=A0A6M3KS13_9ZZZZ